MQLIALNGSLEALSSRHGNNKELSNKDAKVNELREEQSKNHFSLSSASILKVEIFHVHTASRKILNTKRTIYANKQRENAKLEFQHMFS